MPPPIEFLATVCHGAWHVPSQGGCDRAAQQCHSLVAGCAPSACVRSHGWQGECQICCSGIPHRDPSEAALFCSCVVSSSTPQMRGRHEGCRFCVPVSTPECIGSCRQ